MKYFQQPSVMSAQQHFSASPAADIQRSRFDRSHGLKTTFNAGELVPIYWDEVLPGDTFKCQQTAFARMATPLKPIMDNIYLETFYFFVPYRLVWDDWQAFCGERRQPDDDPTTLTIPQTTVSGLETIARDNLAFYFGLPQKSAGSYTVSQFPFRAYWLIWDEWFRDQNLSNAVRIPTDDTDLGTFLWGTLAPRAKRHDYFTSCLPWPQKGDPVLIPVGPIIPDGNGQPSIKTPNSGQSAISISPTGEMTKSQGFPASAENMAWVDARLKVNQVEGATINDLRAAFQIQRLLERDARGGTRYIELIKAHFGVTSDDARLQRPEYLGGGSTRININPVAAAFGNSEIAQGDLAGVATAVNRAGFTKSFTEHGIIIGLANVRADLTYQEGIDRFWSRQTRYDFYWPALANLGEQAVLNKEIYYKGDASDDAVFGYQERYAEYRYKPSRITGKFNSGEADAIDVWHLGQDFADTPALNHSFILDNPPIDRVVAVPSEPHFLMDLWFSLQCARPMPVYAVPGMVDHF